MNARKHITQQELQRVLQQFRERGGLVRKLPPERSPSRDLVGERHGAFEHPLRGGSPADRWL